MDLSSRIPGIRRGRTAENLFVGAVYLCLVLVWPLLLGYMVSKNFNDIAELFDWLPGVDEDGGGLSGFIVAFASAPVVYFLIVPLFGSLAAVMLFVGAIIVFGALSVGHLRAWWMLRSSDPDAMSTISAGPVELEGTATPHERTITAPYTETESLICEYERERYSQNASEDERTWSTTEVGTVSVPFVLEADRRDVLVDPEQMDHRLEQDHRNQSGNTRHTEHRLDPDETVYVTGVAISGSDTDRDTDDHQYLITAPEGDLPASLRRVREPPAIISDTSASTVLRGLLWRGILSGLAAIVVSYPVWVTL